MPEALSFIGRVAMVFGFCVLILSYIRSFYDKGYRKGLEDGYQKGFREARKIPLGWAHDITENHNGLSFKIKLADDVKIDHG